MTGAGRMYRDELMTQGVNLAHLAVDGTITQYGRTGQILVGRQQCMN